LKSTEGPWVLSIEPKDGNDEAGVTARLAADAPVVVRGGVVTPTIVARCSAGEGEVFLDFGTLADETPPRRYWSNERWMIDYHWTNAGINMTRTRSLSAGFLYEFEIGSVEKFRVEFRAIDSGPVVATFTVAGYRRIRAQLHKSCPSMADVFWSSSHGPHHDFSWDPSLAPQPPVRVGCCDYPPPMKIKDVRPIYPADALEARAKGLVILEVFIDARGNVRDARVIGPVALLDQAALDAVRQWEFTPTHVDRAAVPAVMTVTVEFAAP
jgi:TonB family protein